MLAFKPGKSWGPNQTLDHAICEGHCKAYSLMEASRFEPSVRRTAKLEAVAGGQQPDFFSILFLNFD